MRLAHRASIPLSLPLTAAITQAAAAIGRLDQSLRGHPLAPAVLHRMRLEAVRRQANTDGVAITSWR